MLVKWEWNITQKCKIKCFALVCVLNCPPFPHAHPYHRFISASHHIILSLGLRRLAKRSRRKDKGYNNYHPGSPCPSNWKPHRMEGRQTWLVDRLTAQNGNVSLWRASREKHLYREWGREGHCCRRRNHACNLHRNWEQHMFLCAHVRLSRKVIDFVICTCEIYCEIEITKSHTNHAGSQNMELARAQKRWIPWPCKVNFFHNTTATVYTTHVSLCILGDG